ncbi:MAG: hypothetical protein HY363_03055 [Candidatus Aenigmarchaeota archaeon]|nr:hypothetical protein [Candidatus Aenigmarchaeota archaeon]
MRKCLCLLFLVFAACSTSVQEEQIIQPALNLSEITIKDSDRVCVIDDDCTYISTHCGACDVGAVNKVYKEQYGQMFADLCKDYERVLCKPLLGELKCVKGACAILQQTVQPEQTKLFVVEQTVQLTADYESQVVVSPGPSSLGTRTMKTGVFDGGHVSGRVILFKKSDGARVVSIEGFRVEPAANLHVYLVENVASEGIDLGRVVSKQGAQQYNVPSSLSTTKINQLMVYNPEKDLVWGSASLS